MKLPALVAWRQLLPPTCAWLKALHDGSGGGGAVRPRLQPLLVSSSFSSALPCAPALGPSLLLWVLESWIIL
jgi:hypothetical protein